MNWYEVYNLVTNDLCDLVQASYKQDAVMKVVQAGRNRDHPCNALMATTVTAFAYKNRSEAIVKIKQLIKKESSLELAEVIWRRGFIFYDANNQQVWFTRSWEELVDESRKDFKNNFESNFLTQ